MWKKIISKSLKKNKTIIYSIPIQLAFQMAFFSIGVYIVKKAIFLLFKMLIY